MPDICDLIIADHDSQRQGFAAVDAHDKADAAGLAAVWAPLASLLELHAAAEEAAFYPHLVRRGAEGDDETLDAIKDHNKIRDAVQAAAAAKPGSVAWWEAVADARRENDDHMGEEEREGIPDFRAHTDPAIAERLGVDFVEWKRDHAAHLDVHDKDPQHYVAEQTE